MAAVKLYGPLASTATSRALACLLEKQVEYQLIPVDLKKREQKKPGFLAMQPFGQVPVLQDGALTLFESRAIVRYIAEKYAAQGTIGLLGKSLAERAVIEQWMEVESQTYNPPSSFLVFQLAFAPLWGIPQNQTEIAKNEKKFSNVLDVYEKRLSESKYLAGDEFSIADLSHLPNTEYIVKATGKAELITSRKYVNAWWENISSRDSWKKIREMSKADSKK
uniref:glutathione transferase n=2 Tax=Pinus subgen. Pinus TaxID=139271 RepID=A0A9E8M4H4_PINYU|nr:phi class glutathione S-transferases [Pinus densata]WAA68417.1 phi class glutathione S-transferases [Pinus yunnanensis]